jgi:3-hydroxyisobutyrate dehydrogenase-like beta-hydroxyacid dehydrogenase
MSERIGIVGLGLVGQALFKRLQGQGYAGIGYDVREEARSAFAASGGTAAASIEEVTRGAQRVLVSVFEDAQLVEVVRALLAAPDRACKAIISITTVLPATMQEVARACASAGVDLVEGPMSGSSAKISGGEGVMFVGGDEAAVQRHAGLLEAITPLRKRIGAAGQASAAKLSTNLVLGLNRAALAEGMALAESLGIDRQLYLDLLLDSAATSRAAREKGPMMVADSYMPPVATVTQHAKDVRLMLELGRQTGQALPMTELHRDILQRAIDQGDADQDNAAVIRVWRNKS